MNSEATILVMHRASNLIEPNYYRILNNKLALNLNFNTIYSLATCRLPLNIMSTFNIFYCSDENVSTVDEF